MALSHFLFRKMSRRPCRITPFLSPIPASARASIFMHVGAPHGPWSHCFENTVLNPPGRRGAKRRQCIATAREGVVDWRQGSRSEGPARMLRAAPSALTPKGLNTPAHGHGYYLLPLRGCMQADFHASPGAPRPMRRLFRKKLCTFASWRFLANKTAKTPRLEENPIQAHVPAGQTCRYAPGLMFWFMEKRFCGSYLALILVRRA